MNRKFLLLAVAIAAVSNVVQAKTHSDVFQLMQKYLSTVTCEDYKREHLSIFDISAYDGQTEVFGVVWSGDKTCSGGSGAGTSYVTPVVVTRWGELVVSNDNERSLPFRGYKQVSFSGNTLKITAVAYLENDPNCCPSGEVQYLYTYDERAGDFKDKK